MSVVSKDLPGLTNLVVRSAGKSPRDIWDHRLSRSCLKGIDRENFIDLHGQGKKLCQLVAGGMLVHKFEKLFMANVFKATLHIVPLIAFFGLKSKVREMALGQVNEVVWLFRTPERKFHAFLL